MIKNLAVAAAFILTAQAASAGDAPSETQFKKYTLENGLTVVLHEDHAFPMVVVNTLYKVGSKNEEPGKTGFAHLFEHYMFEHNSKDLEGENYFKRIMGIGGYVNANTSNDRTDYFAIAPAEALDRVLQAESNRMGFLRESINQSSLDKQRGIVEKEKDQSGDNAGVAAMEAMIHLVFPPSHPYYHMIIGSVEDLRARSTQDVKDFHAKFYLPNNAVLVIAGDFDPDQAEQSIEKWFGPIPSGGVGAYEVPPFQMLHGRRAKSIQDPYSQTPSLIMAFPVPGKGKPEWLEMSVVAALLTDGRNARLTDSLVTTKRIASEISANLYGLYDSDLFVISASPAPGVSLKSLEKEISAEIAKFLRGGVKSGEMEGISSSIQTSKLNAMQSIDATATEFAEGEMIAKNPGFEDESLGKIAVMTPKAASSAAKKYLRPDNLAVIYSAPGGGK